MWSRERGMEQRGWGSNSVNRSRLMQAQNRGPPLWQRDQDNVKGGTGDDAHGGDGKGGKVGNGEGIRGAGDHKGQKGGNGGWHRGCKDNTGGKGKGIRGGGGYQGQKGGRAVGMRWTTLAARARASAEAEMATASSSAIAELSGTFALSILPHAYACGRYSMLT